jgi:hypothetical protein
MTAGSRIPAKEIASALIVLMDFSSLKLRIFRTKAATDGIIPTKPKDVSSPSIEIIRAIVVICMKFPLVFCAYFTKIISK